MVGYQTDVMGPIFRAKEDISLNLWFSIVLPTRLGISYTLIVFLSNSKFSKYQALSFLECFFIIGKNVSGEIRETLVNYSKL